MQYKSVAEIFDALDKTGEAVKQKVSNLTDEQANARENGTGWTIAEIVEHMGIVESGVVKLAEMLLSKAEEAGAKSDGTFNPPLSFVEKGAAIANVKLQAPERIHPQGKQTIAESLSKLDENRQALDAIRQRIEAADSSNTKFSHPFLGELNLYEWLVMTHLHERRHLQQIERILG